MRLSSDECVSRISDPLSSQHSADVRVMIRQRGTIATLLSRCRIHQPVSELSYDIMLHLILQKNHDFLINMIQQVIPSPVFRAFFTGKLIK